MGDIDLSYPAVLTTIGAHAVTGRTESRAFLGWFLEHFYRLDSTRVEDAICDGPDDKGIDGVYVDSTLETVYVFQSKLLQNTSKTIGDRSLREFVGSYSQIKTGDGVQAVLGSTRNVELRNLLTAENVSTKIDAGFKVQGVFVTNARLDEKGTSFADATKDLAVYDRARLENDWLPLGDTDPVNVAVTMRMDGLGYIEYKTPDAAVFIASLRASELIELAGIENQALFAWNVRQSLGRTKVNQAIAESVTNQGEHKNFMLYHNGLTVLARDVDLDEPNDTVTIDNYSVVNGAQSLSTLNERKDFVSTDLRLLTRIIKLEPASELAAMITRNSNNQNSIGARDLQSNSTIQKRLKEDFSRTFGPEFGYQIKRGELVEATTVISNEEAARALLAFDLEQPWSCHQAYRYFDDLHADIFGRPVVTAKRIVALVAVRDAVVDSLADLQDRLAARYSVMPYFLMYAVRHALALDPEGRKFIASPGDYLDSAGYNGLKNSIEPIARDLITDLNAAIDERAEDGDPFDHKRELKSATAVRALRGEVLPGYEKALRRHRASSFDEEWSKVTAE